MIERNGNIITKSFIQLAAMTFLLSACGKTPITDSPTGVSNWKLSASDVTARMNTYESTRGAVGSVKSCSAAVSASAEFDLAQCRSDKWNAVSELMETASQKIKDGVWGGNNIYAVGVAYEDANNLCAYVQVQQRMNGRLLVKDTLTLPGQECTYKPGQLPFGIVGAFFGKIYGNNLVGGIGLGFGWFTTGSLAGCIAGAAGVASQTFNVAYGAAGVTCGQIHL